MPAPPPPLPSFWPLAAPTSAAVAPMDTPIRTTWSAPWRWRYSTPADTSRSRLRPATPLGAALRPPGGGCEAGVAARHALGRAGGAEAAEVEGEHPVALFGQVTGERH